MVLWAVLLLARSGVRPGLVWSGRKPIGRAKPRTQTHMDMASPCSVPLFMLFGPCFISHSTCKANKSKSM